MALSSALQGENTNQIKEIFLKPDYHLKNVQEANLQFYMEALQIEVTRKGIDGGEVSLFTEDLQNCADAGNEKAKHLLESKHICCTKTCIFVPFTVTMSNEKYSN